MESYVRFRKSDPAQTVPGVVAGRPGRSRTVSRRVAIVAGAAVAVAGTVAGLLAAAVPAGTAGRQAGAPGRAAAGAPARVARTPRARTASQTGSRTSCRSVAHVGDSTSVDLLSPADLPDPADRIGARYADVGVRHLKMDASGGRSIVEELPGQLNGYQVASGWSTSGYRGCWVFALGTNDAANVAVGSQVGLAARIDRMMSVAHGEPVMWVNTRTTLSSGPYANVNEQAWNKALVGALARYPNMRIFDWSAVAQPGWFLPDGIHYNSYGCAMRARAIAGALAAAFPLHGHGGSKIVR